MARWLQIAGIAEGLTGLALLVTPSLVTRLLLGSDVDGIAVPAARVAGIALVALGVAGCTQQAITGMLTYSGLVTVYLGYLGAVGGYRGILLWPAVLLHSVLTVLLFRERRASPVDSSD